MFCRNNFQILSNAVEGNCDYHLFVIATAWTRTMFQACPTLYCEAFFEVFAAVMNAVLVYFPLSLQTINAWDEFWRVYTFCANARIDEIFAGICQVQNILRANKICLFEERS